MQDITFYYIYAFLFGTVFGSFYNVVIYRLPIHMPIIHGRSMCVSCKHELGAFDLVPLLSYLFLRGRCRYCGAKISPRDFVIELVTGLIFLTTVMRFGFNVISLMLLVFFSSLIIVGMIDFDTSEIYDVVLIVFGLILAVLMFSVKGWYVFLLENISGAAIGFLVYFLIYCISKKIYGQESFGFGDVLFNTYIGFFLGRTLALAASLFAFIIAALILLILMLFGKKFGLKSELPFGPFMCISAFIITFFGHEMFNWYFRVFYSSYGL